MEIEAGKYYLTREGNKVGPMIVSSCVDETFFVSEEHSLWHKGGKSRISAHHDIISEWVDESNPPEWYDDSYVYTKGKSPVKLDKTVTYDNLLDVDWSNFEWFETPTSFISTVDSSEEEAMRKKARKEALDEICRLGQEFDASDNVKTPDGGPSSYYDMPFQDWVTLNDQMEYLAENKWGVYAIHLKDVFKGLGRWGDKEGTTPLYDTKKGIYYFCRVMKMMVGAKGLREYLQSILDDPQFKEQNK